MPARSREITDGRAQRRWHPPRMHRRPTPPTEFRCESCGYGAVRRGAPHHCPMCGSTTWQVEGWKPFDAFAAGIDEEDASAPLQREACEVDAGSIFPGVPFS
jgi:hypothetical protein